MQGADGLRVTAQTELHQPEVVPGTGQLRPAAACRTQTLQRSAEVSLTGLRSLQRARCAIGSDESLQGVVATPGPIKDQAEKVQGDGVIRNRPHDVQGDPLGADEISALVEPREQIEERIDHRFFPSTGKGSCDSRQ